MDKVVDKAEWYDEELTLEVLKGNKEAYDYNRRIMYFAHQWDDVHDGEGDRDEIDFAIFDLLASLPHHPFAQRNPSLHPVVVSSALAWMAANSLEERGTDAALNVSYTLRAIYMQVLHYSAYLVGGARWAVQVGERIWGEQPLESLNDYKEEHRVRR